MTHAITVDHLRKRYDIGVRAAESLREAVSDAAGAAWERVRGRGRRGAGAHIWAVDDVSFTARPGDVIGVIGRNGAGKSTLLKILSRITKPTSGYAEIRGRVGSLLEVGTGFHPDLTGRDNIFLNGAMLGMRKHEIERRFDEIVAFSGIEKFLDTPVKRYSSGMYVRLAFAVAAHLEPEVLLVDEVLAVGDVEFQKKCIGKMQDVVGHGRTVIFVSHNMAAVKTLCPRALLLDAGRLVADGPVDEIVDTYMSAGRVAASGTDIPDDRRRSGTGLARFRAVELLTNGTPTAELYFAQPFTVRMTLEVIAPIDAAVAGVVIETVDGTAVVSAFSTDKGSAAWPFAPGWYTVDVDVDVTLLPRMYALTLALHRTDGYDIDVVRGTSTFNVLNVAERGTDSYRWGIPHGYVRPASSWHAPESIEVGAQ